MSHTTAAHFIATSSGLAPPVSPPRELQHWQPSCQCHRSSSRGWLGNRVAAPPWPQARTGADGAPRHGNGANCRHRIAADVPFCERQPLARDPATADRHLPSLVYSKMRVRHFSISQPETRIMAKKPSRL